MTRTRTNPDFLNGVPELLLLRLLAAKPMYGYELTQALCRETGERLDFGEGCIYPILHRLEHESCLSSRRMLVAGRSRVVYRLTARGRRRLEASTAGWRRIKDAIEQVLAGGSDEQPATV